MESSNENKISNGLKITLLVIVIIAVGLFTLYKWATSTGDDTAPLTKKFVNYINNLAPLNSNENSYDTFTLSSSGNSKEKQKEKINRFAIDYCRSSPNITHKKPIDKEGENNKKYNFSVNYESLSESGEKVKIDCVMTLISIEKGLINIEEDFIKNNFQKMICYMSNQFKKFIVPYLHFVCLNKQKMLIKIVPHFSKGTIRDLIKSKKLKDDKIQIFAYEIAKALCTLHKNNFYLLNLQTGNIFIDENEKIKINGIESILMDNEDNFYNYIYEFFNSNQKSFPSTTNLNLFEMIDTVSFGRVLYEMASGNPLTTHYPSDLDELGSYEIKEILMKIFPHKGICNIKLKEILQMKLFSSITNEAKKKSKFNFFGLKKNKNDSDNDEDEFNENNDDNENNQLVSNDLQTNDQFYSLKDILYNQKNILLRKIKNVSDDDIDIKIDTSI